jgi:uncharacterized cupredoxin-like copper-binding protein
MAKQRHRCRRPLLVVVPVVLLLVSCTAKTPPGAPVDVTLKDFRITPTEQTTATGDVVFRVHNDAPVTHEFVVVRTDLPADGLPLAADGLSVNEEWLSSMGEITGTPAGETGLLPLQLAPGHYVMFCNLEGHYLGGMRAVLEVTG